MQYKEEIQNKQIWERVEGREEKGMGTEENVQLKKINKKFKKISRQDNGEDIVNYIILLKNYV